MSKTLQACVILSSSKNKETAKQVLSFIKTAEVADTLRTYGFDVQSSPRWINRFSCALDEEEVESEQPRHMHLYIVVDCKTANCGTVHVLT